MIKENILFQLNLLKNSTDLKDLICIEERTNFDSLLNALLAVFQVLNFLSKTIFLLLT